LVFDDPEKCLVCKEGYYSSEDNDECIEGAIENC